MMFPNVEDVQKLGRDQVDTALQSVGAVSKGLQAIAGEVADHSRAAFESGSAALERLWAAKTLTAAVEVQSDYARTSYENFVARSHRIGDLMAGVVKETLRPYEQAFNAAKSPAAE